MALKVDDPKLLHIVTLLGTISVYPKDFYETEDRFSILIDDEYLPNLPEIKNALTHIKKMLKKNVDIVFYSDDLKKFCEYLFYPAKVKRIEIRNSKRKRILIIHVDFWQRGLALGAKSYKLYRARYFIKKYFSDIDNVYVQA